MIWRDKNGYDIKIKIVSKDDDFMEYVINSDKNVIHYSDLQKYWSYANAIDQESVRVYVQGEWIVGIMLTANAQEESSLFGIVNRNS